MEQKQRFTQGNRMRQLLLPVLMLFSINFYFHAEARTQSAETRSLVINSDTVINNNANKDETVYEIVDQMPEFPGGIQAALAFLSKNVNYPEELQKTGIQGRIIAQFIVNSSGKASDINIIRSVHPDIDKEVIRVLEMMPLWTPGKKDGKAVNVKITIPINFKPSPPSAPLEAEQQPNDSIDDKVYMETDKLPEFPGGIEKLNKYLKEHIQYWKNTPKQVEKGRAIVTFAVRKDGTITDARVVNSKSLSPALIAEAYRVISQMPKWKPGEQNGKPVSVQMTIPIIFNP